MRMRPLTRMRIGGITQNFDESGDERIPYTHIFFLLSLLK